MTAITNVPVTHMLYGAERDDPPESTGIKTEVAMSSGDTFYIDAPPSRVQKRMNGDWLKVGSRWIRPDQVAQLTAVREVPSIHTPERWED